MFVSKLNRDACLISSVFLIIPFFIVDKIELEILGLSSSQSQSGSFALGAGRNHRQSSATDHHWHVRGPGDCYRNREDRAESTYDARSCLSHLLSNFNFTLEEIIISDLKEGVFFRQNYLQRRGPNHRNRRPPFRRHCHRTCGLGCLFTPKRVCWPKRVLCSPTKKARKPKSARSKAKGSSTSDKPLQRATERSCRLRNLKRVP